MAFRCHPIITVINLNTPLQHVWCTVLSLLCEIYAWFQCLSKFPIILLLSSPFLVDKINWMRPKCHFCFDIWAGIMSFHSSSIIHLYIFIGHLLCGRTSSKINYTPIACCIALYYVLLSYSCEWMWLLLLTWYSSWNRHLIYDNVNNWWIYDPMAQFVYPVSI